MSNRIAMFGIKTAIGMAAVVLGASGLAPAVTIPASAAFTATSYNGLNGFVYHTNTNSGAFTTSVAGALTYVGANSPDSTYLGPSGPFTYGGNDATATNIFIGTGADTAPIAESIFDLKGVINVTALGDYQLGLSNDDGGKVWIGGNGVSGSGIEVVNDDGSHGPNGQTGTATFSAAGLYNFEVIYYDHNPNGTGATGGLSGAQFQLTGTDSNSNPILLQHVPEPSSFILAGLGALGLFAVARCRRKV